MGGRGRVCFRVVSVNKKKKNPLLYSAPLFVHIVPHFTVLQIKSQIIILNEPEDGLQVLYTLTLTSLHFRGKCCTFMLHYVDLAALLDRLRISIETLVNI